MRNRRITLSRHPQAGAGNFNFKGGRSTRPVVYTRAFKLANPEKALAHQIVASAIRAGRLVRPENCDSCFRKRRPDAHHWDYSKPLSVEWLCRKCHVAADRHRPSDELTLEEGARLCRFDTCQDPVQAFRKWLRRQGVPVVRRGRMLLVERRVLDAMLRVGAA